MAIGFNDTMLPYAVINGMTNDITGSYAITFFIVVMLFLVIALALRIPLEFATIIILPLALVFMAFTGDFTTFGTIILCYLGFVMAKNFIF
jgi:hypothetical protein